MLKTGYRLALAMVYNWIAH